MSSTHKFMMTLVSVAIVAALAFLTGLLKMLHRVLDLSEETRTHLQGIAVVGKVLLLVAQTLERMHAGFKVIRDFKAAHQPTPDENAVSAREDLEICVQTGPSRHSDYTILTHRFLSREI